MIAGSARGAIKATHLGRAGPERLGRSERKEVSVSRSGGPWERPGCSRRGPISKGANGVFTPVLRHRDGGGPHSRRAPCPTPPTSHLQVLTRVIRAAQLTNFVRFFKVFNAALMQATLWPLSAMSTSGRWQVIHDAKVRRMFR